MQRLVCLSMYKFMFLFSSLKLCLIHDCILIKKSPLIYAYKLCAYKTM